MSDDGERIAVFYDESHRRIVDLVRSLSEEQLATPVAATPGWDVHDVLAHLAAIPNDAMAGRLSGIPTDEFTAGQVRERKSVSVEDLVAEWAGNVGAMCDGARAGLVPPNLAVDAITHEQDIRGAVGAGRVEDRAAVRFSLDVFAHGLRRKLSSQSVPALRLVANDSDFDVVAGDGEPAATLRASEFELFRTLCGRRGREAVLAMDWDGDPSAYLPLLNLFGGVPDYAVAE